MYTQTEIGVLRSNRRNVVVTMLDPVLELCWPVNRLSTSPLVLGIADSGVRSLCPL